MFYDFVYEYENIVVFWRWIILFLDKDWKLVCFQVKVKGWEYGEYEGMKLKGGMFC